MRHGVAICCLLAFALPVRAGEKPKLRRDPGAVAKVEAAEKLAYLPRRAGLTTLKLHAVLDQPGKYAILDVALGTFELSLTEPDKILVERYARASEEGQEILAEKLAQGCVRRDLVDWAVWPWALYPDSERRHIEFAPKSRTRIRIMNNRGTGVEVTFDRTGLPKQHTYYERGKRRGSDKLEFSEHADDWLLVRRTGSGGKDETKWSWKKEQGLWLPESIERTLGKVDFRIRLGYRRIRSRPEGTPPILPPRSDPAALALLTRAEDIVYRPVAEGLATAAFKVTVSDREGSEDVVFQLRFTAPDTLKLNAASIPEALEARPEWTRKLTSVVGLCFGELALTQPPLIEGIEDIEDRLVTMKPEAERVVLISDRVATVDEIALDRNGALTACTRRLFDRVLADRRFRFHRVEGKLLLEEMGKPAEKLSTRFTWEAVEGIWLPRRVVATIGGSTIALTASDFTITKRDPKKR